MTQGRSSGRDGGPARPCARSQGRGCARPASEGSLDKSTSRLDGVRPTICLVGRCLKIFDDLGVDGAKAASQLEGRGRMPNVGSVPGMRMLAWPERHVAAWGPVGTRGTPERRASRDRS